MKWRTTRVVWNVCLLALAMASAGTAAAQKGEPETRALSGEVSDKDGAPTEKAVVYLKNTKTLQVRTYIADSKGTFHFQGLSFNVDYQVHAEHEGASSSTKTVSSFDNRKEVRLSLKVEKK